MGPAGPGIVLLSGQRPSNRRVSWGAAYYTDVGAIAFLRSIGAQRIYLWAFPAFWTGGAAVHAMARQARSDQVDGFIADLERPGGGGSAWLDEIKAAIVSEIGAGLDVGITTFPAWPGLPAFAGVATWNLVQIYPRDSVLESDFDRWTAISAAIMPTYRLIATFVPATASGVSISTPAGYGQYLSRALKGQTWGSWGSGPAYMQEALASRSAMPWDTLVAVTFGGALFGIVDAGYYAWGLIAVIIVAVVSVAVYRWMKGSRP